MLAVNLCLEACELFTFEDNHRRGMQTGGIGIDTECSLECRGRMDAQERRCQDDQAVNGHPCPSQHSTIHGQRMPRAHGRAGAAMSGRPGC